MPAWLSLERALALAGLSGLFLVGIACLTMLAGGSDSGEPAQGQVAAATATPTPTPTPTATPTPAPTPKPLTPEQRAQRSAAAEQIRQQGFEPVSQRAYHPDQTLRVMLGETSEAGEAGVPAGRRAFFFVDESYIGTDAAEVSSELRIVRQSKTTVTLAYGLDAGETETVRFKWDGTSLGPQTAIPPVDMRQR